MQLRLLPRRQIRVQQQIPQKAQRTIVLVAGSPIELTSPVDLGFNSPDINGDLLVNLTDVQTFTADYYGGYLFRSDFHRDGIVNLSDLAPLAYAIGAACP